jgi:hypothetical protein
MNVRQRKRTIYAAAGLLGLAGVAVLAWGLGGEVRVEADRDMPASPVRPRSTPGETDGPHAARSHIALAELNRVAAMDLRPSLFDPPTSDRSATDDTRAPKAMRVILIGTAVEPGRSMALFRMPGGEVELAGEGQSIDDPGGAVVVDRIEHRKVTVTYRGAEQTLIIEPPPVMDLVSK